jgi:hypothetical protein
VPLHAVLNYNGQLTGQIGVHYRFEEELFVRFGAQLAIRPAPPKHVADIRDFMFETLLESFTYADEVLAADKDAIGGGAAYDERYYAAFLAKAKPVLEKRIGDAITAVASIITTQWEQAGRPALPVNAPPRPPQQRRSDAPPGATP